MTRWIRSSPVTWALGYLLLGLAALVAFAVLLWYAWNVSIFSGREEVLRAETQHLSDVFARQGPAGLIAHIETRMQLQIVGERTLLLTDSAYRPLAGNLAAWPREMPDEPGTRARPASRGLQFPRDVAPRLSLEHGGERGGAEQCRGRLQLAQECQATRFPGGIGHVTILRPQPPRAAIE